MIPKEMKFTETHEWVKVSADGKTATVGITHYAVEQLGDIVYLELKDVGDKIKKDSAFGVIESVKAAFDLNSPVSGEIIEVNQSTLSDFDNFSKDPYGEAWMIKLRLENKDEIATLMNAEDYENLLVKQ